MNQPADLHHADPTLRRHARWLPLAVLGVGLIGLWLLHAWLQRLQDDPTAIEALMLAFLGLGAVLATAALALGWHLWRIAGQITTEDRYPPSMMRTLRDVPLRRGEAARRAARVLRTGAVLAGLVGLGVLAWVMATVQAAS
jgi:hypothetical protein